METLIEFVESLRIREEIKLHNHRNAKRRIQRKKFLESEQKEIEAKPTSKKVWRKNYEDLLCKFKLLSKEHEELKLKIESIKNETNDFLEMEQSIPCAIPISKVDASTFCIDLIDESCSNPCNEKCYENIVVESCDDLIAKEND